jgi:4-amino-4-deoxy-L-arabinose transferase-like glycosyltransferase
MAVPVFLFLIALCARAATFTLFPDPAYPDSFYYVDLARQLAAGHGFSVDFIWNFVEVGGRLPDAAAATLPIPSNAHWMPLAAIVQVPFIWLLGATPLASALPFWLAAAATAPVTWWICIDAGRPRWQAFAAALLIAVPGGVTPYLAQADNFSLFMLLGALSLWACARGLRGDRRAFVLGGLLVGLATLSRNDGILLGIPFAIAFLLERWRSWRHTTNEESSQRAVKETESPATPGPTNKSPATNSIGWRAALGCMALFLIAVAPWYLRQMEVFGSLSPSAASGRILWITDYQQLYSVTGNTTLSSFLAQGLGPLLESRVGGLAAAAGIFVAMPLLVFLAPFTGIGAWVMKRDPNIWPWLVYAVSLLLFSGLLFAVHVPYGTFLHSAVALLPHAYLLSLAGIGIAVTWVARHRRNWNAPRAMRVFGAMAVAVVVIVGIAGTLIVVKQWRAEQSLRETLSAAIDAAPATDRVMSPDAGGYRYLTGHEGVVTPDDPLPVVEEALRLYDIRWLALEADHITPALAPILAGTDRPAWLSAPLVEVPPDPQSAAGGQPGSDLPRGAIYAVCLDPGDQRCSNTASTPNGASVVHP